MTVYRTTRRVRSHSHGVILAGTRTKLEWLDEEDVEALLRRGIVTEEAMPDLAELAGWKTRATRLARINIVTVEDFMSADPEMIAKHMRVKEETAERWTKELETWFEAPPPKRG